MNTTLNNEQFDLNKWNGKAIVCHLHQDNLIYYTGLKVMENFRKKGLLSAWQSSLNGELRLLYDVERLLSLDSILPSLSPEAFLCVTRSLLDVCDRVQENGFIQEKNILIDPRYVFIDSSDYSAYLLYLPFEKSVETYIEPHELDTRIRRMLLSLIEYQPNIYSIQVGQAQSLLRRSSASIKEILGSLKNVTPGSAFHLAGSQREVNSDDVSKSSWQNTIPRRARPIAVPRAARLVSENGRHVSLDIPVSGVIIGRVEGEAQRIISDLTVSAKHCRIWYDTTGWKIEDLGSKNGTSVNGVTLEKHRPQSIRFGDTVSLAKNAYLFQAENGG